MRQFPDPLENLSTKCSVNVLVLCASEREDSRAREVKNLVLWDETFLTVGGTQGVKATSDTIVKSKYNYLLIHLGNLLSVYCIAGTNSFFLSSKGINHLKGEGQRDEALGV